MLTLFSPIAVTLITTNKLIETAFSSPMQSKAESLSVQIEIYFDKIDFKIYIILISLSLGFITHKNLTAFCF